MNLPGFWASASGSANAGPGREIPLKCFGWSDVSVVDARERAAERLGRLIVRVREGAGFPAPYVYASRPIREERIDEMHGASGELQAVVTRNAYGASVLNTAGVLFADVDDPPEGIVARIRRAFGNRSRRTSGDDAVPVRIQEFAAANPGWGLRCYRTRAGWRVVVTHDVFDPVSNETTAVLTALGSDPKYVQLTRVQRCFRARLTPKPWRCGVARPERDFPREGAESERAHARWLEEYSMATSSIATCRLVAELGRGRVCDAARTIIARHDADTKATSSLPLA